MRVQELKMGSTSHVVVPVWLKSVYTGAGAAGGGAEGKAKACAGHAPPCWAPGNPSGM